MNHLKLDDVVMNCVVITDLTEQKRHEKTLASERLARLMLEQAGEAILVCDHTGIIIRASQVACQIWKRNLVSQAFDTLSLFYAHSYVHSLEQPELNSAEILSSSKTPFSIRTVLDGETVRGLEVDLETSDGQALNLILNARPLTDRDNHFRGAIVILTDITRRKQTEIALKQSQTQLQQQLAEIENIYQCAPIGLNVLDTELRFVRINQRLAEMNGLPIEAHIGHTIRELFPNLADQAEQLLSPILETGEPCLNVEINGETPAQPGIQRTWLESFLPLKDGDRIIGINTVCEEITDRKRIEAERQKAEEALRQAKEELENRVLERTAALNQTIQDLKEAEERITVSLREKEVLLKEIHHRVKNNLGIVSSLLQMQIRRVPDPQTNLILQDSQNRIASIALVHEKLYRSDDLANVDLSQYIQDLTVYLFDSYNINSSQIRLIVQVENVHLDIETVIPFGLIINELVSNALKHAFPGERSGEIQIRLTQSSSKVNQQQTLVLVIQDNGLGLAPNFELKKTKTLGLTLVQGLVRQIGATLEIVSQEGTQFKITLVKS
ncbi:PAS domain-containing protein [Oscillatoria sp. FACHB-1407]|nr:PAS domain-containing protein [Oscillatoria sp. FACHB-1407]